MIRQPLYFDLRKQILQRVVSTARLEVYLADSNFFLVNTRLLTLVSTRIFHYHFLFWSVSIVVHVRRTSNSKSSFSIFVWYVAEVLWSFCLSMSSVWNTQRQCGLRLLVDSSQLPPNSRSVLNLQKWRNQQRPQSSGFVLRLQNRD